MGESFSDGLFLTKCIFFLTVIPEDYTRPIRRDINKGFLADRVRDVVAKNDNQISCQGKLSMCIRLIA